MVRKIKWKKYKADIVKEMENAFLVSTENKTIYLVKDSIDYEIVRD